MKQSDNNNPNTPIQEEWIIHDKILPDDKWNAAKKTKTKAKRKTKSHNNVHIAQQKKTILKTTPPVNFQFLKTPAKGIQNSRKVGRIFRI